MERERKLEKLGSSSFQIFGTENEEKEKKKKKGKVESAVAAVKKEASRE